MKLIFKMISKCTYSFRIKIVKLLIRKTLKHLFINSNNLINYVLRIPRPSILIIKNRFKNMKLVGAEIGVKEGINSLSILNELNIKKLFLIDVWENYKGGCVYDKNNYNIVLKLYKNNEKVEIIKEFSNKASKGFYDDSLDFCYIDANHTFKYVYDDLCCWYSKVRNYGVLCGHEIHNTEVYNALSYFCSKFGINFQIIFPDWYIIKEN